MKSTAWFYDTPQWRQTRDGFIRSKGGLCELCLSRGIYEPAVIAHHRVHLTPENVHNPEISLSWSNLQALCRKCHGEVHRERRFTVDELGRVQI